MQIKIAINKKGTILIASYLVIVILTILAVSFLVKSINEKSLAETERNSVQAFYLAEAGLNQALWYLQNTAPDGSTNGSWRTTGSTPVEASLGAGSYAIWVEDVTANVRIRSRGTVSGLNREVVQTFTVTQQPGPFESAAYVGGSINDAQATNLNISGVVKEGGTNLPTVDLLFFKNSAGSGQDISGNYTFTAGTYSGVWFVDGNVIIESNVTVNGTIVATGNVSLSGKSNITIDASPTYPALLANGNFDFKDALNVFISGVVYVGADMEGNFLVQQATNITFSGTIIVAGNFNLQQSDTVTINYVAGESENIQGFTGGSAEITIDAAKDWHEI